MDLTDQQWQLIKPLLPPPPEPGGRGRPPLDSRRVLNGILWKLRNAAPWRDIPPRYASHQACYLYYRRWKRSGLLQEIIRVLFQDLKVRGSFNLPDAIQKEVYHLRKTAGRSQIYIHAGYIEDWRVSTAMIDHQNIRQWLGSPDNRYWKYLKPAWQPG
jgi:transposase